MYDCRETVSIEADTDNMAGRFGLVCIRTCIVVESSHT